MEYGFQGKAKMCITAKMAISMQSKTAGMPIEMSVYASDFVGCSGPFEEIGETVFARKTGSWVFCWYGCVKGPWADWWYWVGRVAVEVVELTYGCCGGWARVVVGIFCSVWLFWS